MINKLVMVDIPEPTLSKETRAHLMRFQPGGIILFRKNIISMQQTKELILELQALLGKDLLLAIDMEGGGVWRTNFLPYAPSAMNLGSSNNPALAREVGQIVGRGLRSMGINWNFAPVLDINNNPANPVISDRSFGENPQRVSALGLAWADGLMSAGVAACAKHFPGHGDTHLDSHLALPTVTRNLEGLEEYELVPFRAAVAAQLPSIMTAHIIYPSIDPDLPATLSKKILTGLLRERAGYNGVIVTDSMGMHAIDENWGRGDAAILSVQAGSDMLEALGRQSVQEQTFLALEEAAKNGSISLARIDQSLERLHGLARRFPIAPLEYPESVMQTDSLHLKHAWQQGIVAYNNPKPPTIGSRVTVVAADEVPGEYVSELGISGSNLVAALSSAYQVSPIYYQQDNPLAILEAVQNATTPIIFASTTRKRLTEEVKALARAAKPDLHLALWNPYNVLDVPAPAIVTFGYRTEAIQALLEVLKGAAITGIAPIRL